MSLVVRVAPLVPSLSSAAADPSSRNAEEDVPFPGADSSFPEAPVRTFRMGTQSLSPMPGQEELHNISAQDFGPEVQAFPSLFP